MQDLRKQGLAVIGMMTILFNGGNVAQGQSLRDDSSQINNVFELRDVSPDDWAFEALRNLIERYGCLAGSPDGRLNARSRSHPLRICSSFKPMFATN